MKKIKSRLIAGFLMVFALMQTEAQTKVSILGDSYSTFGGEVTPSWNLTWYEGTDGAPVKDNDVRQVEQTWWRIFVDENDYKLEKNNSFSGSTICTTGYSAADYSDRAFITRIYNLGDPDIIVVFGGTNDSWARAPIGEYKYENWNKADLATFRPAMAYLLNNLIQLYPTAKIYNLTNSQLSEAITSSMQEICNHYGVPNIQLHDIDKQQGHPSQAGMREIAKQLNDVVNPKTNKLD